MRRRRPAPGAQPNGTPRRRGRRRGSIDGPPAKRSEPARLSPEQLRKLDDAVQAFELGSQHPRSRRPVPRRLRAGLPWLVFLLLAAACVTAWVLFE